MNSSKGFVFAVILLALLVPGLLFANGQSNSAGEASGSSQGMSKDELMGAGASFPYPIYSKMFDEYNKQFGIKVNYQSIGSSGGIKNIKDKVVDFGASDAFLSEKDMSTFDAPVLHIPTVLGSIVVTYNLPGNPTLKLTGEIVADIFLGKITKWNDPALAAINSGIKLPGTDIIVAHRSDGSGTTNNFTEYLSRVSASWKEQVGVGKSVNWPVGLGGAQNAGVAGLVKQTTGSIGYVELAYADQNNLPYATLKNKAGNWVVPSLATTSLAADMKLPADTRVVLADTDATDGYSIATLTWLLIYKEQNYAGRTLEQAKALVDLIWWMTHDGQQYAESLEYAPIPDAAVKDVEAILKSVTYDGKPVRK